jgi:uncharacterized protein
MILPEKERPSRVLYNVAQLLKSSIGDKRNYNIDEPFGTCDDVPFAGNVHGQVELTHVNQGIVVKAVLNAPLALECSRCLDSFGQDLDLSFEERFIPTIDVYSGLPVHEIEEDEDEEDVYIIDEHHVLDLHEAIRQQALINMPMQPLHSPDCAGLCPRCGINRNSQSCSCHADQPADPRLSTLATWFGKATRSG